MNRDLSAVFVEEKRFEDHDDEDMILAIEDSAIFRYDEKKSNFDFETDKSKAEDLIASKVELEDFYNDLSELKLLCHSASPSNAFKAWMMFWAVVFLSVAGALLLIIWIVLILDLVVLAGEIYILKKFKKAVWSWKSNKVDKGWVEQIERVLNEFNQKYKARGIAWKFDSDGKWIQLSTFK